MTCDLHIARDIRACSKRCQRIPLAVNSTYLYETFDALLDTQWVRLKSACQLPRYLVDEIVMCHVLAIFHDAYNASLRNVSHEQKDLETDQRTSV